MNNSINGSDSFRREQGKFTKEPTLFPNHEFNLLTPEEVVEDSERLLASSGKPNLFEVRTAKRAIQDALMMPDPVMLFDPFIVENEVTILFADTGIGKTVLAVQMAIDIAGKGNNTLYLDLELSDKQFQKRYTSNSGEAFELPEKLFRAGFNRLAESPKGKTYEDFFFESLIEHIELKGIKVVFLDNLTKLAAGDTDTAKDSIPIIERLNKLQRQHNLTIVIMEHNKKVDQSRPILLNDLQGSKMKPNLVDAVITIGRCAEQSDVRYIKQLKVRDGEIRHDTNNVLLAQLSKARGYLSMEFMGTEEEQRLLRKPNLEDREMMKDRVQELHEKGYSLRDIGSEVGISHTQVSRIVRERDDM